MVPARYDTPQAARNHPAVMRTPGRLAGLRSRRQRQRLLAVALRAQGHTWVQIAQAIQRQEKVGALAAFRLAHGWSQLQAAEAWNHRWPDELKTGKNFSYWERWPYRTGRAPSLEVLERLAELYACRVGDLLNGHGDYRHLDPHQPTSQPDSTSAAPRTVELPGGMGALARQVQAAVLDALTTTLTTPDSAASGRAGRVSA